VLSKLWAGWRHALVVVVPATVVRWHRQGFRYFWTWKSKKLGRPTKDAELRALIRRMARENGFWGAPRIHGELLKLGFEVAQRTVARWMPKRKKPSGPSWKAFLGNQLTRAAAIDFFVLPTATFRVLYGFVLLDLERRKIVHVNATEHPTAEWTARQIVQAFPYDSAPKFLMRDRDSIYGERFRRCVQNIGIQEVLSAPRCPKMNAFAERVIGTIRRECTDHVIVLGENHLRSILRSYQRYYNASRTHLALAKDAPNRRAVEPCGRGRVVASPQVGGLHHRYTRRAA
jgi:transposase InsO family protein